ncbi:protein MFAP1 homolog isoform X2 [Tribolium castaneum]|uniref:Uncharacterized protein n=1 Tax=Tribolium castaneum TaxID=7070 RepID=D6WQZ1_TRICA|nr:PREDICTED: protein MFAP1 homolog isoform X2 [Tribolium castaneum]EFA06527.2 hypothetical protein TcasGA2_TC009431 [Tribolium castaneum]|eukprot:XP_008195243.1 PREDICTED: protein MFAP1 homolog isoform X2 [Tribolium castaneum]
MERIYVSSIGAFILYTLSTVALAKPFEDEKSFSDDNKLHCVDSNDVGLNNERSNPNSFAEFYKPRSRFEGVEKFANRPFDFDTKRSAEESPVNSLEKRQVGVVYKDEMPIGILQPYQRSYRFIPIKEQSPANLDASQAQDVPYSVPSFADIDKREVKELDETYPSILTNFKIVNKLEKKRNYDDKNVRDLKATIRRLRSANPHNNEKIEEELKNILDDMGLIEDEESHGVKREASDDSLVEEELVAENERNKRDDNCNNNPNSKTTYDHNPASDNNQRNELKTENHPNVYKRESSDESERRKRQKSELVENLKDSGELMVSGNKSPLASSEITNDKRSSEEEEDYESRIERNIQNKINSLKEEVKREIEALRKKQDDEDDDEEDYQRKKRQVYDTLMNEETDQVNPAMNPDNELKPLVRKRRQVDGGKRLERSSDARPQEEAEREKSEEGGELLGDFNEGAVAKREVYSPDQEYDDGLYDRNKRDYDSFFSDYYYNNRAKRQNRFVPMRGNRWRRFRRRINEDQDLFGALPKSYDGELSRYKRVKRK